MDPRHAARRNSDTIKAASAMTRTSNE